MASFTPNRVTFGLFELDAQAGELWRGGHRIRPSGQPLKVLIALLARPGEVVTREELQAQVWDTNTNVDFERGVAGAINKVRDALGDSAENPRFIQTLPKRGYRFIAPVAAVPPAAPILPEAEASSQPAQQLDPHSHPFADGQHLRTEQLSQSSLPQSETVNTSVLQPLRGRIGRDLVWASVFMALLLAFALRERWLWQGHAMDPPLRIEPLTHSGAISTGPPNLENLPTLATDGDRIFTSVMQDGQPRLSTVSISTGEVQAIPLPQELMSSVLADVSRDGTRLLLKSHTSSASEQPLWIAPSSGGSAFRVGGVLAHDAAWMPDGEGVLYANGNELFIVQLNNGTSRPFAHTDGRAFWMRWSPDGLTMRFTLLNPVAHPPGFGSCRPQVVRLGPCKRHNRNRRPHAVVPGRPMARHMSLNLETISGDGRAAGVRQAWSS